LTEGKPLPIELKGQVVFYVGPSVAKPGRPIGSAGPTSSYRMDSFTPLLIEHGLKGMIGKGSRSQIVKEAMMKYKAIYFTTIGGAALISKSVLESEVVAYPELGTEAIYRLKVVELPLIVINDVNGADLYELNKKQYSTLLQRWWT
jgi:fumarate hydratase subunit beta